MNIQFQNKKGMKGCDFGLQKCNDKGKEILTEMKERRHYMQISF